jgi:hypothetical protein
MSVKESAQSTFIPPVGMMKVINGLQRFFFKLSKRMIPAPIWMIGHIENFWLAKGLVTALELNIAEHIQQGNDSADKLAKVTQTNPDALFRLMRMLCAHEIFRQSKNGTYQLTPYSKVLVEGNGSVKYMLLSHLGKTHSELFTEMDYTIKTGTNVSQKLFNKDVFAHIAENPTQQELFIKGMSNTSDLFAPVLLSSYDFSGYNHIIDIGGGYGNLLCNILTKHTRLKATLIDSKYVVAKAVVNIESFNLKDRIDIKEGNFFDEVPDGGDLYILKNILHDWNDENTIAIMKNIHKAMPAESKLLIIETLISNDNKYSFGKMLDILMMLGTEYGRERTGEEYKSIIEKSGFEINKIIPTISPFSLIECVKKN